MEQKANNSAKETHPEVPGNFRSTITDFTKDLSHTFPEFQEKLAKWNDEKTTQEEFQELFVYCLGIYPQRFFDILNQNDEIFQNNEESSMTTEFIPNVDFKQLYHCEGVSEQTRQTIWKYLQLILFILVGTMKDKMDFGDAMNMFDQLGEDDLQGKLQEAMGSIHEFFSTMENAEDKKESADGPTATATDNMPQPEQIHDHLMGLFDGKIGKLAKELATDFASDIEGNLGFGFDDVNSSKDVLQKLMQNPNKISGLVKTVGEKLNEKMESGEVSQQDLLSEAGSMMRKMKEMGGGNMGDMFKNMAQTMGMNIPKGARFDENALNKMDKMEQLRAQVRERAFDAKLKKDADELAQQQEQKKREEDYAKFMAENPNIFDTEDPNSLVYRVDGDKQQKSSVNGPGKNANKNKKKKKKGKK